MTDFNFYKAQKTLWKSNGFFSPTTGEPVKLSSSEKAIHMYLSDRIAYFVGKLGNEFFEEQGTIAEELGLDKKTVWRCMKKFKEHSVITGDSRRTAKGNSLWFYKGIKNDLSFWTGSEEDPKPLTNSKVKQNNSNHVADRVELLEHDDDLPEWAK